MKKHVCAFPQRTIILFLLGLLGCIGVYAQNSSAGLDSLDCISEEFSFPDASKRLSLNGTLTLPQEFNSSTKMVILVAPPLPIPRDYDGLFSTLANVFGKNGIATLRFDNRAYSDNSLSPGEEMVTMHDQAADVHNAILKLRKDKRFIHNPIGLLGHSEGGCSVAIEASRNKTIDFVVLLSTCGIKGVDFAYEQTSAPIIDNKKMDNTIKESMLSSLNTYLHIVDRYNSVDSMRVQLRQAVETYYNSIEDKKRMFGGSTLQELRQTISWSYSRPRFVSFIKYNPIEYYSKLTCPALVICGKMDGNLDCKTHLDGIEKIFKESGKRDYDVIALDSVNHGYKKVRALIPMHIERILSWSPHAPKPQFAFEAFEDVATWIRRNGVK